VKGRCVWAKRRRRGRIRKYVSDWREGGGRDGGSGLGEGGEISRPGVGRVEIKRLADGSSLLENSLSLRPIGPRPSGAAPPPARDFLFIFHISYRAFFHLSLLMFFCLVAVRDICRTTAS